MYDTSTSNFLRTKSECIAVLCELCQLSKIWNHHTFYVLLRLWCLFIASCHFCRCVEELWIKHMKMLFKNLPDEWVLNAAHPEKTFSPRWSSFKDLAKVRFYCRVSFGPDLLVCCFVYVSSCCSMIVLYLLLMYLSW